MSYIFRSDTVTVGDRVTVRRKVPGGHSDVIGHILAQDAAGLEVRPQKVGGYASSKPSIYIPREQVVIIKKLSPRRILNSEIRALEVATAKAFPGIEHQWTSDGQWLLRAGDGITERSNSAAPLGSSAGLAKVPWEEIFTFYKRHNLPVQILIPERIARSAEGQLKNADWSWGPEILVMTRQLMPSKQEPDVTLPEVTMPAGFVAEITEQPDAAWLERYHFRGQPLPQHALELLQQRIEGTLGFGQIREEATGNTVAITRGTITDTFLGFSAVEVDPAYRRRGLGRALGQYMLHWGASHAATSAYLQVIEHNDAGYALYKDLGFIEHHRHRYVTRVSPLA